MFRCLTGAGRKQTRYLASPRCSAESATQACHSIAGRTARPALLASHSARGSPTSDQRAAARSSVLRTPTLEASTLGPALFTWLAPRRAFGRVKAARAETLAG